MESPSLFIKGNAALLREMRKIPLPSVRMACQARKKKTFNAAVDGAFTKVAAVGIGFIDSPVKLNGMAEGQWR